MEQDIISRIEKAVSNIHTGKYNLNTDEFQALWDLSAQNKWCGLKLAFEYGFVKGQRAEKNNRKRRKDRTNEGTSI